MMLAAEKIPPRMKQTFIPDNKMVNHDVLRIFSSKSTNQ